MRSFIDSPNVYARMAGLSYLLIIFLGLVGYLFIREPLFVSGDAAATASNILQAETVWRLSITGDVLMHALDIPVMVILYFLLKQVNKPLAVASVAFNLVQTSVLVANKLVLLVPLLLMKRADYVAAFEPEQIHAQVMLLANLHDYGFGLGLIFFGCACIGYGVLIFKSNYFPRFVGVLMMMAGTSYLINSLTLLIAPSFSGVVFPILVLSFLGELTFALWLIFKGVHKEKWHQAVARGNQRIV
ncbi:DUF4386 domain-containing protein [Alkalimonas amylolytica]|uniref:DUF4386 domain-containing protein n=1 Tax=Alkalimonas amylolytica TaxID=152573 RepID=A0A1H4BHF1_ALKAM|nr:DUF4386 domain-containing protein [Alkalimonas amylolytica]SEA47526.1 protein of unknown function [Alkalimonas amylolytica]